MKQYQSVVSDQHVKLLFNMWQLKMWKSAIVGMLSYDFKSSVIWSL